MRAMFAIAISIMASGSAYASYPRPIIIADIDMSEWTPPMSLTLDTDTGRYTIVPTAGPWPTYLPKPQPRNGTLTGDALAQLRLKLNKVISAWRNRGKVNSLPNKCEVVSSNGGVPHLTVKIGNKSISGSDCWTPAEVEFHHLLDKLFDHKTP